MFRTTIRKADKYWERGEGKEGDQGYFRTVSGSEQFFEGDTPGEGRLASPKADKLREHFHGPSKVEEKEGFFGRLFGKLREKFYGPSDGKPEDARSVTSPTHASFDSLLGNVEHDPSTDSYQLRGQFSDLPEDQQDVLTALTMFTSGLHDDVRDPTETHYEYDEDSTIDGPKQGDGTPAQISIAPSAFEKAHRTLVDIAGRPHKGDYDVHRGMSLPSHVVAGLNPGAAFDISEGSSWSADKNIAQSFSDAWDDNQAVVLSMAPKFGTDITNISEFAGEREFIAGGKVKVVDKSTVRNPETGAEEIHIRVEHTDPPTYTYEGEEEEEPPFFRSFTVTVQNKPPDDPIKELEAAIRQPHRPAHMRRPQRAPEWMPVQKADKYWERGEGKEGDQGYFRTVSGSEQFFEGDTPGEGRLASPKADKLREHFHGKPDDFEGLPGPPPESPATEPEKAAPSREEMAEQASQKYKDIFAKMQSGELDPQQGATSMMGYSSVSSILQDPDASPEMLQHAQIAMESLDSGQEKQATQPDLSNLAAVAPEAETQAKAGVRRVGHGAYGRVYGDDGPPPIAIKYGEVQEGDLKVGSVASDLGIGPKVYGGAVADVGTLGSLSMEYLQDHQTFDEFMSAAKNLSSPAMFNQQEAQRMGILSPDDARKQVADRAVKALQAFGKLHRAGYAHNDAHYGNFMTAPDGDVKMIDYGLAIEGHTAALQELSHPGYLKLSLDLGGADSALAKDINNLHRETQDTILKSGLQHIPAVAAHIVGQHYDKMDQIIAKHGYGQPQTAKGLPFVLKGDKYWKRGEGVKGDKGYFRTVSGTEQFFEGEPGNSRLASPEVDPGMADHIDLNPSGEYRKKEAPPQESNYDKLMNTDLTKLSADELNQMGYKLGDEMRRLHEAGDSEKANTMIDKMMEMSREIQRRQTEGQSDYEKLINTDLTTLSDDELGQMAEKIEEEAREQFEAGDEEKANALYERSLDIEDEQDERDWIAGMGLSNEYDPFSAAGKKKIASVADKKDGWETLAKASLYRGGAAGPLGKERTEAFDIFVSNPENRKKAQQLWDKYGVVLVPPREGDPSKTVTDRPFKTFTDELDKLDDAFDVRSVVSKMGLTMSFSDAWIDEDAKRAEAATGSVRGNYFNVTNHINLFSPDAQASTFVHELFHALDYFNSDKRRHALSTRGDQGEESLSHFVGNVLPQHYVSPMLAEESDFDTPDEYREWKDKRLKFREYQAKPVERFARLSEDFFTEAMGTHTETRRVGASGQRDEPMQGYWGPNAMAEHAGQIAQEFKKLGVDVKPEYVEKVKNVIKGRVEQENKKRADVYQRTKDQAWGDVEAKDIEPIYEHTEIEYNRMIKEMEEHGAPKDVTEAAREEHELDAGTMIFDDIDPRARLEPLKKLHAQYVPTTAKSFQGAELLGYSSSFATLIKGKGHKYIKREIKDPGPPRKYRYWYKLPKAGLVRDDSIHVGAKFQHGSGDDSGHYEIVSKDDVGNYFKVRHDETGHTKIVTQAELHNMLNMHHREAVQDAWDRRRAAYEAAWKYGTDSQVAARKKDLIDHSRGYHGTDVLGKMTAERIERDNPRRSKPSEPEAPPEKTPEQRQQLQAEQQQHLDRLVAALTTAPPDMAEIQAARDAWTQHQKEHGALVSIGEGVRPGLRRARRANRRRRDNVRDAQKAIQPQVDQAKAQQDAYKNRSKAWLSALNIPDNIRSTQQAVDYIDRTAFTPVVSFGGFTATGDMQRMTLKDAQGKRVTEFFGRRINSLSPHSFEHTVNKQANVVDLHNSILEIYPHMRTGSYAAQLYARQEDYLREVTRNFPDDLKANVVMTIDADITVGKYYWATQGFRYEKNSGTWEGRKDHLQSLINALNRTSWDETANFIHLDHTPRDANGNQKTLKDLGITQEQFQTAKDALRKALDDARSADIPKDQYVEPWEVLQMAPKDTPPVWVENKEGDDPPFIKCDLMKFLFLNGDDWVAVKHVHGPTERDRQGIEQGDARRAKLAARQADQGKPWDWVGSETNDKLKETIKKSRTFRTSLRGRLRKGRRFSLYLPQC